MYYYLDIIQRRGQFGIVWLCAFDHAELKKRSTVALIKSYDVDKGCNDILRYAAEGRENSPRMNLYVTSTLLCGLCKLFKAKSDIIFDDAAGVFVRWGEVARLRTILDSKDLKRFRRFQVISHSEVRLERFINEPHQPLRNIRKRKRREDELEFPVLTHEELAEILRQADEVRVANPSEITMSDVPPIPPQAPTDVETLGGEESFLPELREILKGVESSTVRDELPAGEVSTTMPVVDIPVGIDAELIEAPLQPLEPGSELLKEKVPEQPQELAEEESLVQAQEQPKELVQEQPSEQVSELLQEQVPEQPMEQVPELPQEQVPEQPMEQIPEQPMEQVPELPQEQVPEQPMDQAPEQPVDQVLEQPQEQVVEQAPAELQPQPVLNRRQRRLHLQRDEVINVPRKPIVRVNLHDLTALRNRVWAREGYNMEESKTMSPVSDLLEHFPILDDLPPDCAEFHCKMWPWFEEPDRESRTMQHGRGSVSDGHHSSMRLSIGSPTPGAESRTGPGVSPISPSKQMTELVAELLPIPEIVHLETGEPSEARLLEDLSILEEEVPRKRVRVEREQSPRLEREQREQSPRVERERSPRVEREQSPRVEREQTERSPVSSKESSITRNRLETCLLTLVSGATAECDRVTFAMLAPPASTSRLNAARLFTAILSLEAKQMIRTEQIEPYGDIVITLC